MATSKEIQQAIKTLIAARLRNAPAGADLADTSATWLRVMADVPGPALVQAADDLVLTVEFWPSIKQVRDAAHQVQIHNGASVAANPWKEIDLPLVFCYLPEDYEHTQVYPDHLLAEIERIEKRTGDGLLSDADFARIERMTAPYLAQALGVVEVGV